MNTTDSPWHSKKSFIILALILLFPLGLYLMWKNELWNNKIRWVITTIIAAAVISNIASGSSTSCECADIYSYSPSRANYSASQLNDGDFLASEASKYVERARGCVLKFGGLSDVEVELVKGARSISSMPKFDQAIRNAMNDCAKTKRYSDEELALACDCWNQSVSKSGMAFDNMTPSQQKIRKNCNELFGSEIAMEEACKQVTE